MSAAAATQPQPHKRWRKLIADYEEALENEMIRFRSWVVEKDMRKLVCKPVIATYPAVGFCWDFEPHFVTSLEFDVYRDDILYAIRARGLQYNKIPAFEDLVARLILETVTKMNVEEKKQMVEEALANYKKVCDKADYHLVNIKESNEEFEVFYDL
jgi:hypothetical protein